MQTQKKNNVLHKMINEVLSLNSWGLYAFVCKTSSKASNAVNTCVWNFIIQSLQAIFWLLKPTRQVFIFSKHHLK